MGILQRILNYNNTPPAPTTEVVYNVAEIHEQIQVDPNYRAGTTQPSIFLNGNYVGNVTVFSFLGTNWTISTQDGIVSIQTTGGGGGGSFVVKKDGNVVVASTTNLNFTGQSITVTQDATNPNQANISVTGGITNVTSSDNSVAVTTPSGTTTRDLSIVGKAIQSLAVGSGGTSRTGAVKLIAGTNITISDNGDNTFTFNSSGGGGGATASFTASPSSGNAPLTLQLTDTSNPTPTSWQWTISPNTYTVNSGSVVSNTLNITLNQAVAYTISMTPTKSGTTYSPATATQTITPTSLAGDFTLNTVIEPSVVKNIAYFNYTASDLIRITPALTNTQTCSSVTSSNITSSNSSTAPIIPAGTLTPAVINNGTGINSTAIPATPTFIDASNNLGVTFTTSITAVMNNSDGSTATKTHTDVVGYYVPAFYAQTNSNTPPQFSSSSSQVVANNYATGQSFGVASNSNNWVWVAIPLNVANLTCYSQNALGWATQTPDIIAPQQTISRVVYSVFGYNQGTIDSAFSMYIDSHPTLQLVSATSDIVTTTAEAPAEAPAKVGFFAKLFGAK